MNCSKPNGSIETELVSFDALSKKIFCTQPYAREHS